MAKSPRRLNDGDMTNDNSPGIDSRRSHLWLMDGPEVDLFPSKKQAVEVPNSNLLSGMPISNISSWENASYFHSFTGPFTEWLFDPDAATRTMNFESRNISSVSLDKSNVERNDNMDPFVNHPSYPQSCFNYGRIRKVEVSEVRESENVISVPTNHLYDREGNNTLLNSHAYNAGHNSISMSLTYNKGDDNIIFMGDVYGRTHNNFISMVQSYNKGHDSLSIGQAHKEACDTVSMDQGFSKVDGNVVSITETYNKADGNSTSREHIVSKREDSTISLADTYHQKRGNNMPLVARSFKNGESTIISFGGCDDDDTTPSGRLFSGYEHLLGQAPSHRSDTQNEKELLKSTSNSLINAVLTSTSGTESKIKGEIKVSKKAPSNNFPSNVRSLLSTGMLDGIPVKYKAWSREGLRGVIKGSGYLCSCQSCNFSKLINAYEFERHAGCKTKHPNNHIYFENGKTIYGIVQELRSTPQNMLCEVIQTITGSPINQKSFRIWKDSFLAATCELQRIYGKDEVKQLS